MNKAELVRVVAKRIGRTLRATEEVIDATISAIVKAVESDDAVRISGFGCFKSDVRAARTGRNPRTGKPINIKIRQCPIFVPGSTFKKIVGHHYKYFVA